MANKYFIASCVHGTTRLVDGDDKYEGRLEMCISGKWGTVCDNGFSTNEARAACSQLGLPSDGMYNLSIVIQSLHLNF